MNIPKRLIDCLDENKVDYEILRHPEAVTAQRTAEAEHVKGRHHAKVVMLKSGGQHLMAVLPAEHLIDLKKLATFVGKDVSFESEQEFESLFPDCAVGAMPPFWQSLRCAHLCGQEFGEGRLHCLRSRHLHRGNKTQLSRLRKNREAADRSFGDQDSTNERSVDCAQR